MFCFGQGYSGEQKGYLGGQVNIGISAFLNTYSLEQMSFSCIIRVCIARTDVVSPHSILSRPIVDLARIGEFSTIIAYTGTSARRLEE